MRALALPAPVTSRHGEVRLRPRRSWLAPVLLLAGCAFPAERGQRLEQRVERLETEAPIRAQQPDGNRAASQEQAKRLEAHLAEMQAKLNELGAAVQEAKTERAGRHDKVDRLADEVSRLRAGLEGTARRLDAVERSVARVHSGSAPERRAAAVAPAPPARGEVAGRPQVKTGFLALAREQEVKGQKEVARDMYQQYLEEFPAGPDAAEAHYRLGEIAFADRRYRDAIAEYGAVAKEFPRSSAAPDALLRTADSMVAMDLREEAVAVLSEVPKRYPSSPAAPRARARISELTEAKATPKKTGK
jgi:tol-pal system protein YbgF